VPRRPRFEGDLEASLVPIAPSPIPRRHEISGPNASASCARGSFVSDVVAGIASVGDSPPTGDQPRIDVLPCEVAFRNDATVPIDVALLAADGSPIDMVLERQCCLLGAAPASAVWTPTFLTALRRIYAEQTNALAMNFDRVAIDDAWNSDDLLRCRQCRARRQEQRNGKPSPETAQAHHSVPCPRCRAHRDESGSIITGASRPTRRGRRRSLPRRSVRRPDTRDSRT
jgi:hypothetical protein